MVEIRNQNMDSVSDAQRARARQDDQVYELLQQVRKDRTNAVELARLDPARLSQPVKEDLQRMVADQLRGQLPQALAQQLQQGTASDAVFARLLQRFANANDPNPNNRFGTAPTPDAARANATDQSVPQQALQWTQFVQKVTHIPQALVRDRAGTAGPKGEGTTLLEILGARLSAADGASLRLPQIVERAPSQLSPAQRQMLMNATFGPELSAILQRLGITDPLQFVRAGALPSDRTALAQALGLDRGELLTLLMRAELLRVGPGRNGELGIRPEFLLGLKDAGVAMLGTLAAMRALSHEELTELYKKLRAALAGFGGVTKSSRPIVKRDLIHWARSAARRPSDIMLADREQIGQRLGRGDAQELVQAWYLENLFWTELAAQKRQQAQTQRRLELSRHGQERIEQREGRNGGRNSNASDETPSMSYDEQRGDNLMCFWITDYNAHSAKSGMIRRMYVCIDPMSGAIIPQAIEAEMVHGLQ